LERNAAAALPDEMSFRLVEPLLHFFPNSVVNWTVGSHRSGKMKVGVFHSRRLIVLQACCANLDTPTNTISNLLKVERVYGRSFAR